MMVDMDTSADIESLEDKEEKVATESEWRDCTNPGLVQVNADKSVEEIRAEHYVGQNIEKDEVVEPSSDGTTVESNVVEPVQDIVDSLTRKSHNSNNNLTEEHIGDIHTISTHSDVLEDSTYSDIVKSINDAKLTVESAQAETEQSEVPVNIENPSDFNSFQFWRTPIPVVELDLDLLQESSTDPEETFRDPFEDNRPHTDQCAAFANTLEDLSICDNLPNTVIEDQYRMSRESLGTNEVDISDIEPIQSIDDTETTMRVINGVVQGEL